MILQTGKFTLYFALEPRQFKNNFTMFESKLILKLPPFFTHCVGERKKR